MGVFIYSLELLEGGMGVDLCRRQALMPQQLFHTFQSGLMVEHGCGERMPEHMRGALPERGHAAEMFPHLVAHAVAVHALALLGDKKCLRLAWHLIVAPANILLQRFFQFLAKRG